MDITFDLPEVDTLAGSKAGVFMAIQKLDGSGPLLNEKRQPRGLLLLGSDSPVYEAKVREIGLRRIAAQSKVPAPSREELLEAADRNALELLVTATVGWRNITDSKGQEVSFSPAGAEALYSKFPAVKDQAEAFIRDRINFLAGSVPPSSNMPDTDSTK